MKPHWAQWLFAIDPRAGRVWCDTAAAFAATWFTTLLLVGGQTVGATPIDHEFSLLLPARFVSVTSSTGMTTFWGDPNADGRFGVDPEPPSGAWQGELFTRPLPPCPHSPGGHALPVERLLASGEPAQNVWAEGRLEVVPRQSCVLSDCTGGDLVLVPGKAHGTTPPQSVLILEAGWFTQHPCGARAKRCGAVHLGVKVKARGDYHGSDVFRLAGLCAVPS